jgi:hypothetical protein
MVAMERRHRWFFWFCRISWLVTDTSWKPLWTSVMFIGVPGTRLLAVSLTQSRTVYYMGFLIAAPQ